MLPSQIQQPFGRVVQNPAPTIETEIQVARSAARLADALGTTLPAAGGLAGVALSRLTGASTRKAKRSKSAAAGYARAASTSSSSKASTTKASTSSTAADKKSGPLSFLDDPKLSVEDKLMRLLAYLNDKWEKEMEKKMKEMSPGQSSTSGSSGTSKTSTSSTSSASGGIVGSLVSAAKKFFPEAGVALGLLGNPLVHAALEKLGGPVLAAAASALGMPALAPALLKYGPQLADLAAGIASGLTDEPKGASSSSAGGASSSSGSASSAGGASSSSSGSGGTSQSSALSDGQERLKLMEIQRIYDNQKEMFSLVSNILRSAHDTRMAVIQNVR